MFYVLLLEWQLKKSTSLAFFLQSHSIIIASGNFFHQLVHFQQQ